MVLGGTGFVGGAVVTEAVRRDWTVTVLNRGLHGTVPPGVSLVVGDRNDADCFAGLDGQWDLVVDTWDGAPVAVQRSAGFLESRTPYYAYVSSRSVYREPVALGVDESWPTAPASPSAVDGTYAELKSGAERAVTDVFGERALLARAGLILGPGEDIGRLPWWLGRIARGGTVLAPGPSELPLQYIDARDLAGWLLDRADDWHGGPVNVVSRTGHTTMDALLAACVAATGSSAVLRWVDPAPILAAGVVPWNDLPIWIPPGHEYRWLHEADVSRAYSLGLRPRPVSSTVSDTWEWLRSMGGVPARAGRPARASVGLDPEREAALLAGQRA
ncbi:MAG: reductase [Actinobacteria bacterium 13_1_20CM_3_71_11]|nr:MAG: reductase [Actinobacteria bacterium 13_1_20CM_3_71_11]